ncbi:MAG: PDZ domain-containing protein, partial [bacterium]|nr:PDZ domain-containing protein [bacterium]
LVSLPSSSYPYPNYHSSETNDEYLFVNAPYAQNSEGASLANRQSRIAGIFTKSGLLTGHYLQAVLTNYLSTRALFWPSLGLNYMVLSSAESLLLGLPSKEGMLVVSRPGVPAVSLNGAAATAGIREGDFIYRLNNGDFSAVKNSLNRVLSTSKPGDQIEMVFWRAGVEQTIKATLKSLP